MNENPKAYAECPAWKSFMAEVTADPKAALAAAELITLILGDKAWRKLHSFKLAADEAEARKAMAERVIPRSDVGAKPAEITIPQDIFAELLCAAEEVLHLIEVQPADRPVLMMGEKTPALDTPKFQWCRQAIDRATALFAAQFS